MHFWIDKRSQTCGFSGRHRVPSSISTGGFGGRHRHRGGGAVGAGGFGVGTLGLGLCSSSTARNYNCHPQAHVKLMVTPVHRFQSIECVAGNAGRYHQHGSHHRSSHHHARQSSSGSHHLIPSPSSHHNNRSDGHQTSALDLDSTNGGNFLELPSLDGASHHRTSTSHEQHPHNNMMLPAAGKLKCGMWASFAIVTVFMVGAKFYFNNQSTGMEVLIFCSLLVVVLFAGCTVSLCEAVTSAPTQPLPPPLIIDSTANRLSPQPHNNGSSTEDLRQQHSSIQNGSTQPVINNIGDTTEQPQPPPPYHIAVLLPQHQPSNNQQQHHIIIVDDSPPPSYDKVVIS